MKLLWERRNVADNHVDPSFLSELKRNQNLVQFHWATVVGDASVLLVNITLASIFVLSFVAIYEYEFDARWFVGWATCIDLVILSKWFYHKPLGKITALKSGLSAVVTVLSLTPVFRSLTESTSSDSIWNICGWLLLLNATVSSRSYPVLSTNTALAATIVLASRLSNSLEVFYFVLFNIESFVTLPTAYKWLKYQNISSFWSNSLASVIILSSWILMWWIMGTLMLFLWLGLQSCVLFGIPWFFLSLQLKKDRISGPWDAAKPVLN